jgi:preprotein translocase subunit YajC
VEAAEAGDAVAFAGGFTGTVPGGTVGTVVAVAAGAETTPVTVGMTASALVATLLASGVGDVSRGTR